MKKSLLAVSLAAIMLASCNESNPVDEVQDPITTYSLVTSEGQAPVISKTTYNYLFDRIQSLVVVSTDELRVNASSTETFSTDKFTYWSGVARFDDVIFNVVMMGGKDVTGTGGQITDLNCYLTTAVFSPSEKIDGYPVTKPVSTLGYYPVMTYDFNGANVRTFWPDMTFRGETSTTISGANPFSTNDIEYRVVMNLNNNGNYTADVFFLKARFAEAMKVSLNIALRGLPVVFDENGFSISAPANISPETIGDGGFLTNDSYKFDSFEMKSSVDMTQVEIDYTVMSRFVGHFEGKCVVLPSEE